MSTPPSWMPICHVHGSRWLWKGVSRETFPPVRRLSRVKTVLPWRTARATLIWRGADSGVGEGGGHCLLLARRIPPRVDVFHVRLISLRFTYVLLTFGPPIAGVADCGLSCERGGAPCRSATRRKTGTSCGEWSSRRSAIWSPLRTPGRGDSGGCPPSAWSHVDALPPGITALVLVSDLVRAALLHSCFT